MVEPTAYCIVDDCWNMEGHCFPKDEKLRKKWLLATKKNESFKISPDSKVCLEHFTAQDYEKGNFVGTRPLVKDAIPSVFSWNQISDLPTVKETDHSERKRQSEKKALKTKLSVHYKKSPSYKSVASQTQNNSLLSHSKFTNRPSYMNFYTGLESHEKFSYVYSTLGPTVDHLGNQAASVPLEDQFFLTLMKLRRNTPDIELALFFNISMKNVKNIIVSWIPFMASEWSELNTWPSRGLVDHYIKGITIPDLLQMCQEKDSVDPEFPQMVCHLANDWSNQKGFKKCYYVEKLIGLSKMYEILRHKLKGYCEPLEGEIHYVCAMLCHYRQAVL